MKILLDECIPRKLKYSLPEDERVERCSFRDRSRVNSSGDVRTSGKSWRLPDSGRWEYA